MNNFFSEMNGFRGTATIEGNNTMGDVKNRSNGHALEDNNLNNESER